MSDPRKKVSHEGIGTMPLTYQHDGTIVHSFTEMGGSVQVGKAVGLVAAQTVGLGANGGRIEGKLEKVEPDGFCGVNTEGGLTLPAAAPIANGARVVLAGGGLIRAANPDGSEDAQARWIVEDGTVAASIKLYLR
jgi:hypothetical protein